VVEKLRETMRAKSIATVLRANPSAVPRCVMHVEIATNNNCGTTGTIFCLTNRIFVYTQQGMAGNSLSGTPAQIAGQQFRSIASDGRPVLVTYR
jgi:hypothetical protein